MSRLKLYAPDSESTDEVTPEAGPELAHEAPSPPAAGNVPKVSHEPDSRRRHARLTMPLLAAIGGKTYTVADWSLSGMQITDIEDLPGIGGRFHAELSVPFSEFRFALTVTCEIVWLDLDGKRAGCRFVDLRNSEMDLLRYMVDAFVSGRIATVDGLLQATYGEHEGRTRRQAADSIAEASRGERLRQSLKRGALYGLFVSLGLVLAVLAGSSLYNKFFAVTTDLGWVYARVVPLRAPAMGKIQGAVHNPGTRVEEGKPLLRIENRDLEGEHDLAVATLDRELELLAGLRRRLVERQDFFSEYNELAGAELQRAKARVDEAKTTLEIARRKLDRAKKLHGKGHFSAKDLEEEEAAFAKAELNWRLSRADLVQAGSNAQVASKGYYYTGTRVEGGEPAELQRQIALAEEAVNIARVRAEALRAQRDALQVESPCNCIVQDSLAAKSMWVERGDLIYRLADVDGNQTVKALVPQGATSGLRLGATAEVQLADRTEVVYGRVVAVDRTPAEDRADGYGDIVANRHRFAEVTVALDGNLGHVPVGLPARLVFPIDVLSQIAERFAAFGRLMPF